MYTHAHTHRQKGHERKGGGGGKGRDRRVSSPIFIEQAKQKERKCKGKNVTRCQDKVKE